MIPTFVITLIFGASLFMTLTRGVAAAFALVFLPALLLIYRTDPVEVEKLPDINVMAAVSYGVIIGLILQGRFIPNFRFHVIDLLIIAMSGTAIISSVVNEELWTGVSTTGTETLENITPYFMARAMFLDRFYRLQAAKLIAYLSVPLAFFALVEFRIDPMFFSRRLLDPFGLTDAAYDLVLQRFGFFRAQVSIAHPIDLGNGGVLLGCLLLTLGGSAGATLKDRWVQVGVICCLVMSFTSISFTSFVAVGAIVCLFTLMRIVRVGGWLLTPILITAIIFYTLLTIYFVTTPLPEEMYLVEGGTANASFNVRHLIVANTWVFNENAGWFGYGKTIGQEDLGLLSVDNAYMLFLLRQGWSFLLLFLAMGLIVCWVSGKTLARMQSGEARLPMAAGAAGIVGTMMGMYTVFFGFVYAKLFIILVAFMVTMSQMAQHRLTVGRPLEGETDGGPEALRPNLGGAFPRPMRRLT